MTFFACTVHNYKVVVLLETFGPFCNLNESIFIFQGKFYIMNKLSVRLKIHMHLMLKLSQVLILRFGRIQVDCHHLGLALCCQWSITRRQALFSLCLPFHVHQSTHSATKWRHGSSIIQQKWWIVWEAFSFSRRHIIRNKATSGDHDEFGKATERYKIACNFREIHTNKKKVFLLILLYRQQWRVS